MYFEPVSSFIDVSTTLPFLPLEWEFSTILNFVIFAKGALEFVLVQQFANCRTVDGFESFMRCSQCNLSCQNIWRNRFAVCNFV